MKLEIEVTDDEIKAVIEKKIHSLVAEYSSSYYIDSTIKDIIKKYWIDTVDGLVKEELVNSDKIRATIRTALENKIKAQLQALISKPTT